MNLYNRCVDFDFDNFCICCKAQHFELLLHFELFPIHTTVSRSQFSRCSQKTISTTTVDSTYSCASVLAYTSVFVADRRPLIFCLQTRNG